MKIWSSAVAVLGVVSFCAPAFADTVTSRIVNWNPATKQLTLADRTKIEIDPAKVVMPEGLAPGDEITISFVGSEDGYARILEITPKQSEAK